MVRRADEEQVREGRRGTTAYRGSVGVSVPGSAGDRRFIRSDGVIPQEGPGTVPAVREYREGREAVMPALCHLIQVQNAIPSAVCEVWCG